MGIRSFSTDSTVHSDEVYDYKHSRDCPYVRSVAWIQRWIGSRPRRNHQKIEKMHKAIEKNRNNVQESMDDWELHRITWLRRAEAWEKGEDISIGECKAGRFAYNTAYRYKVTVVGPISGTKTFIVDFRTPQGRAEALQWYERRYQVCIRNGNRFLVYYNTWEEDYKEYMYILAKSRDQADLALLRRTLLHGVPKIHWSVATAKRLPN